MPPSLAKVACFLPSTVDNIDAFKNSVDKNLIMDIDRDDNGQSLNVNIPVKYQSIPSLISSFNPVWYENDKESERFLDAVLFLNTIFNNRIFKKICKSNKRKKRKNDS